MREFGFRAWSKRKKEMFNVTELSFRGKSFLGTDTLYGDGCWAPGLKESREIMQYTGFRDKNGKKIYEGDILKISGYSKRGLNTGYMEYIAEVSFVDGHWSCSRGEGKSLYNYLTIDWARIEVIGNIYENPKMLEEDK